MKLNSPTEHQVAGLLFKHGGLYIDLHVILIKPLSSLFDNHVTITTTPVNTAENTAENTTSITSKPSPDNSMTTVTKTTLGTTSSLSLGSAFVMAEKNSMLVKVWVEKFSRKTGNCSKKHWSEEVMDTSLQNSECIHVEATSRITSEGDVCDYLGRYSFHVCLQNHPEYDPRSIRTLNCSMGKVFRLIYYQDQNVVLD